MDNYGNRYDDDYDNRYDGSTIVRSSGRGHSVASLTLGILGLLFLLTGMPFISLILGIIGVILASGAKKKGCNGSMTTTGAVLSWISIVMGIIITILFFLMIAGILMFGGLFFRGAIQNIPATTAAVV